MRIIIIAIIIIISIITRGGDDRPRPLHGGPQVVGGH